MKAVASLPGKIMLAGEYAVLFGGRALSGTLDKRLTVTALQLAAGTVSGGAKLSSEIWADEKTVPAAGEKPAPELQNEPFAQAASRALEMFGLADVHFTVTSELRVEHGVGTSSALRAGVLTAANALAAEDKRLQPQDLAREAWRLQRLSQSMASGYDVATQMMGGVVSFRNPATHRPGSGQLDSEATWPVEVSSYPKLVFPLREIVHPYVGGRGAPTGPVMLDTLAWLEREGRLDAVLSVSEELTQAFGVALSERQDHRSMRELIEIVTTHRSIFAGSPHDPVHLRSTLERLPGEGETWTFKTTGAGGEDALLLIGEKTRLAPATLALYGMGWDPLNARFASEGVLVE